MKKTLNRALLKKAQASQEQTPIEDEVEDFNAATQSSTFSVKPSVGGAGSAWKAGAAEQNKTALAQTREKLALAILSGAHELLLDTEQVFDRIGTDRRKDWRDQEPFQTLQRSIDQDGQDTPIQVWPTDPNWQPDRLDPTNIAGVEFDLITGRRRHAVCGLLGKKVRAILASPEKRGVEEEQFEQLFMRFRENEEREDLGPFERLCSIGEMFEELQKSYAGKKPTAVLFASRINVHESVVSRGRAIFKAREQILNKFKNAYALSYPELQKALASLTDGPPNEKGVQKKINVSKKVGGRKLSLSSQAGKLSISTSGLTLDEKDLDRLGDVIADHLNKLRSK